MPMPKFPKEPDNFKYFQSDPPEVKLEAWRRHQNGYTIRYLGFCLAIVIPSVVAVILRW
ncbi:hypothetical protein CLU84_3350 [Comamonas sp. 26]|nr:hypothetical protein CLU84_3350 [Comamonas sp. 26]